jgi:ligand-binding sensor domain-containing protein/signal transduction histidine kinase/DNA-binding response OmpR family regulator
MLKRCLIAFLLSFLINTVFPQNNDFDFRFERITIETGLSNSEVNSIIQDSTGFIWIGTRNGLNRFDGNRFLQFFHYAGDTTSIISSDIRQLYHDQGDNFWIATNRGVGYYNGTQNRFYRIKLLEDDGSHFVYYVNQFTKDLNGNVIAASSNGLYMFDRDTENFTKYPVPTAEHNFLNWEGIQSITTDRKNRLWLGSLNQGLYIFDQLAGTVIPVEHIHRGANTLRNNKIFCIFQDSSGTVWVGTETGLYVFDSDGKNGRRYLNTPGSDGWIIPHPSVNYIYEDTSQRIWILTNGGVSLINRDTGDFYTISHQENNPFSLGSNAIRTMFEDKQGNLWLGTVEDGVNLMKTRSVRFDAITRTPGNPFSLNYPHVLSVELDDNNNLWMGTNGGGINIVNPSRTSVRYVLPHGKQESGVQIDAVMALFRDRKGLMWAGTYQGGLGIYNPKTGNWKIYRHEPGNPSSLSNDIVNFIEESPEGKIMVATNHGLNFFDPVTELFTLFASASDEPRYRISNDFVTHMLIDQSGNCWVATYYGLNRINMASGNVYTYFASGDPGSISDNVSYFVFNDSKGRLWIGTEGGLNLYDYKDDSFMLFGNKYNPASNTINSITEDRLGFLWLGTDNGLSRFDPENHFFSNFNIDDGLASVEFSMGAVRKSSNGRLYFGGRKGVISFDPMQVKAPDFEAPLVLTNLAINNVSIVPGTLGAPLTKGINYTDKLVLKHDQSFITIDFTILDFITPRKGLFQYKLEGFDNEWVSAGYNRSANYTRLPAGRYIFRARVIQNFDRITYSKPLEIIVKPPMWLSTPAYFIYFIIFSIIIYGVYRFFNDRAIYRRMAFVEKMESEKLIELNQAKLRFFINVAHEFKTPLTLILSPLEQLLQKGIRSQPAVNVTRTVQTAYRNAMRLSKLTSQIMELRRIDSGNLKLKIQRIEVIGFLKEIASSFNEFAHHNGIAFEILNQYDNYTIWADADKLEKSFFNLLSNAFRFTPQKGDITVITKVLGELPEGCKIQCDAKEGYFVISVIDTGPGIEIEKQEKIFERFYQNDNDVLADPASTGIGLSIVKEFIEAQKGCVHLESAPGAGSTFSIILPLGKEHFAPEEIFENEYDNLKKFVTTDERDERKTGVKPFFHETARGYPHKILVIEDNHELRNFILDNLEHKYEVHEADNGREGLRMAKLIHPDLIISDIMMPGISGIELVKTLKSDVDTSHIPIILMTVLSELNQQVEGMETGADAYLTKPFHFSILEANITSLIENRRAVINKFLSDNKQEVNNIPISKLDQAIMKKAMEVMERNMENDSFTAEDFSLEMNMSRSTLHVKLKALTNLSATEFIRAVRLKKALELLSSQEYSVSQVATMVGFKSISYFNRCFKNTYGHSPSNYL